MNDSNVGKIIGIYEICSVCDNRAKDGHLQYHVRCTTCGFETDMKLSNVKDPQTCRHIKLDGSFISNSYSWENQRIGAIFRKMMSRCYSNKDKDYGFYGAKGIKICKEWLNNPKKFEEWSLHNGYSDELTIDRIDSNKNYAPENCQWISLAENVRKAGEVNWITINNITLTGRQWAEKFGLGVNTINTAIRKYGVDKTKELISAMIIDPLSTKNRKSNQSWFSAYGIQA